MAKNKQYLKGSAREIVFNDGGSLINVWIDLDDLSEKNLVKTTKSGRKGVAFTISKRREEGEYGDTHYMYVQEREEGGSSGAKTTSVKKASVARPSSPSRGNTSDELPF